MDSQELRNLQEAYLEVVENQQLDEISSSVIARTELARQENLHRAQDRENAARDANANMEVRSNRAAAVQHAAKKVSRNRQLGVKHAAFKIRQKARAANEQVDIYDIILSHLLDEGYAETQEAAEAIMVNMSEEWRESICEEENETPIEKKSKYGRKAPAGYMQTRKPTLQQMSSREKEAWRNRGIGA